MAFHTPGGGEIQLLKCKEFLEKKGIKVDLFDLWNPKFIDYDIFHFFSCISGSNHICNFVKRLGIPVVISSSLWLTKANKDLYPAEEIRSHLLLADKVITNSIAESVQLSTLLDIPLDLFQHVYNGVDPLFSQNISPDLFRGVYGINGPFLLNVGNIEPRKNQLFLAEAASRLNKKLVLIGHIRDQSYANELFSRYQKNIRFIGSLPHADILVSAYKACEVFCLPSILETPGLAAIEAVAAGTKVIVTSEGAAFEYFGNHVQYVNPNSIESILQAISQSYDHVPGQFDISRFYWSNTIFDLEAIYRKLIESKKTG